MANKITVSLPEYFSIDHYKKMGSFEHLSEIEKVIYTLVAVTEHDEEEVKRWNMRDLLKVYEGVGQLFDEVGSEFYPVFEFKGITYGFQPLSKMNVGEWIDADKYLDNPIQNLEVLMALLYRPITSHKFEGMEWKVKSYIKTLLGDTESIFKYYEVEEYDTEKRDWRAEIFKDLPIEFAMGALVFFMAIGLNLQQSLVISSPDISPAMKKKMSEDIGKALQSLNTTGGSKFSTTQMLGKYLTSQVQKTSSK